jgi:hypothetical protein
MIAASRTFRVCIVGTLSSALLAWGSTPAPAFASCAQAASATSAAHCCAGRGCHGAACCSNQNAPAPTRTQSLPPSSSDVTDVLTAHAPAAGPLPASVATQQLRDLWLLTAPHGPRAQTLFALHTCLRV